MNSKVAYIYNLTIHRLQTFLSLQTRMEWVLGGLGLLFTPPNASALRHLGKASDFNFMHIQH